MRSGASEEAAQQFNVVGETQWRHSIVLSDSSSDSALLPVDLTSVTEFLKGEMWGKSKIPSSSTLMMGMSKLQRESGTAETQTGSGG